MDKWSFNDSFIWENNHPECGNNKQSPINIDTNLIKECNTLCDFDLIYKNSNCYINYKNNNIRIKYSTGSYFKYQDVLYELKEITIHTPSLHSIDGEKYDLEICLVHSLDGNSDSSNGIMLCCLFESGPHHGEPEQFINQIINEIPIEEINYDKEINVSETWGVNMLLPENKSFFMYEGSLPYPPCTEKYNVFVFETIGKIGSTNINMFKEFIGKNIRKIQPLNDRTVFYKSKIKNKKSSNRVIKTSSNKYLKCAKAVMPEKKENNVTKNTGLVDAINNGIDPELKQKIKKYALVIVCVLLFILAYYFVVYLFKYYKAQKILMGIAGKAIINNAVLIKWKKCDVTSEKDDEKKSSKDKEKESKETEGAPVEEPPPNNNNNK